MEALWSFYISAIMATIQSPDHTLLMQKGTGKVISTLARFGMATGDIPWPAVLKAKDLGVVDCPGESGERTHFPDKLSFEAYDLEFEFKYRGSLGTLYDNFKSLRDYLSGMDGNGTQLNIYSPYCGIGRQCVSLKSIEPGKFKKDNAGEYMSFKVKFRVADPVTDITLVESNE